jgi:purine nucleosidase
MRKFPLIHDHDGHIDDLISLALLATQTERKLIATTLTPADCYLEPATLGVEKLLTFFKATDVAFARSTDEGINPFPHAFRKDSNHLPHLKIFSALSESKVQCSKKGAVQLISDCLQRESKCDVIETGPLTNIAEILKLNPTLSKSVNKLIVMGGALGVPGNVETEKNHDGSAEWNFYNHPIAADLVLKSGIPITLVSLDLTNQLPVTQRLVERLKKQLSFPFSQLVYESWQVVLNNPDQNYYLWDILTAVVLLRPDLFNFTLEKIKIQTHGPSQGRTLIDKNGIEVSMPQAKNVSDIEDFILESFKR